jgi:hypothetical protein
MMRLFVKVMNLVINREATVKDFLKVHTKEKRYHGAGGGKSVSNLTQLSLLTSSS